MGDGEGVREGSPHHAARVRCSLVAGLHPGAVLPTPLYGNGSGRPSPRMSYGGGEGGAGRRVEPRRPGLRQALRFLAKKSVQRFQASVAAAAL
jgi:hypothetical protein